MLNVIVLIAMAVTAAAFAAGMTRQAGLPLLPVLIATAALFLAMAASFVVLRRPRRGGGGDRLEEFEEALEIIDADLQRIDRIEDDISRLDLLSDRVERLDQALADFAPSQFSGGQARIEELASEFENVYARIESLRADIQAETHSQRDQGLLRRQSGDLSPATASAAAELNTASEPLSAPSVVEVEEEVVLEMEETPVPELADTPAESEPEESGPDPLAAMTLERDLGSSTEPETLFEAEEPLAAETTEPPSAEEPFAAGFLDDEDDDDAMRDTLRKAVESGRIELFLQPTVTLPDRKVRYYEALTRIRTADDDLILPGAYVPVAKRAGMMPLVDNVLLVRSVQNLRRLSPGSKVERLFCNVSMHSLLDPDYFPELVEFMEENNSLSESLVFEISQAELLGLTEAELGCLDTLGALGYNFCLDNVTDFDADFAGWSDRYFRYVKISAESFLSRPGRTAADLKRDLDGLGIQLIIEKVEDEGNVAELLDHGIELAQGYLFGKPKPSDEALSREREDAGAA